MPISGPLAQILARLREFREAAGITTTELEQELILGPGWIESFEAGRALPAVGALLAILHAVGRTPAELFDGAGSGAAPGSVERFLFAEPDGDDLILRFPYADFDASYRLPGASLGEFEEVLRVLRDGLAGRGQKSDAIVASFRTAMDCWPEANPSDMWWFLVQRAYLDPFNHPASAARTDLSQSWKRAAGWALERILVAHYGPSSSRTGCPSRSRSARRRGGCSADFRSRVAWRSTRSTSSSAGEPTIGPSPSASVSST